MKEATKLVAVHVPVNVFDTPTDVVRLVLVVGVAVVCLIVLRLRGANWWRSRRRPH